MLQKYKQRAVKIIFAGYIFVVMIITQFPIKLPFKIDITKVQYNLVPFYFLIKRIEALREASRAGYNIILFLPFGFLLPIIRKDCPLKKVTYYCFSFSLCIEVLQLISMIVTNNSGRCFDIDDIIANTIGGIVGFYFCIISKRLLMLIFKGVDL
uniref:VanZ family protein n=1 Tax=Caldicellulosiruptor owensensis TaxID=55205 RepID=A0A7C5V506_9FIRM